MVSERSRKMGADVAIGFDLRGNQILFFKARSAGASSKRRVSLKPANRGFVRLHDAAATNELPQAATDAEAIAASMHSLLSPQLLPTTTESATRTPCN